ncbi:MAG TPA: tryptophan-rich sensory protein [Methanomassiliicoccales archaeon]|nr:tryptophan-rich sensory protein [Methanomassiliicoccales archaeon]
MAPTGSSLQRVSNVFAYIVMIVVNGIAGATTLIGGRTTADVSNAYPTPITPAGYVFAIWGVIYVLLAAFVVYQALPRNKDRAFHERIGWLFVLSCALNIIWIVLWQSLQLGLSVLVILLYLLALVAIYVRLDIGKVKVGRGERLTVHLPFSVYLGWLTIATVADVAVTLTAANWDGFGLGLDIWMEVMFLVILVVAVAIAFLRRDIAYELVIIWAFAGIAVNQGSNPGIFNLIIIGAILVALATTVSVMWNRWFRPDGSSTRR